MIGHVSSLREVICKLAQSIDRLHLSDYVVEAMHVSSAPCFDREGIYYAVNVCRPNVLLDSMDRQPLVQRC